MVQKTTERTIGRLSAWQRRVFFLCWGAYTLAYLTRINLSIAIPLIEQELRFDKTVIGLIGSTFFWIYAIGQLINGRLGDRFRSRTFIFTGLLVSAAANIAFSFTSDPSVMVFLWAINGYFQSILWGSLIRTLHCWFPKKERPIVGLYIFSSVLVGFLLTWGGLPTLAQWMGWRGIFLVPGLILAFYSVIWILFVRNRPEEVHLSIEEFEEDLTQGQPLAPGSPGLPGLSGLPGPKPSLRRVVFDEKLYLLALCGIPLGFIREGIGLWAPTILLETFRLDLASTMGAALMIPFFNFLGVFAVRLVIRKFEDREASLAALLLAGAALSCVFLYWFGDRHIAVYVPLLGMGSLLLYGSTSILTSVIPLHHQNPSTVAGFLDFSIYLGAGLSGLITGWVAQRIGWSAVLVVWMVAALMAGVWAQVSARRTIRII